MPSLNKIELDFKRDIRKWWDPNWSEAYEPGTGSGNGYPDLQFLEPKTLRLLPIELKVGDIKGDRIFPREVRPAQVVWHYKFALAQGRAAIAVGIWTDKSHWRSYAFPGYMARTWKEGWPIAEAYTVILHKHDNPNQSLGDMIDYFLLADFPANPYK